jgi:hypothetical protein
MRSMASSFNRFFGKVFFVLALVCSFSVGWLGLPQQSSYAAEKPTMSQMQSESSLESREQAYEKAKEIADDPKMGIQKEYEEEVEVYREENVEGGIIEEAKELVTKVTGN